MVLETFFVKVMHLQFFLSFPFASKVAAEQARIESKCLSPAKSSKVVQQPVETLVENRHSILF